MIFHIFTYAYTYELKYSQFIEIISEIYLRNKFLQSESAGGALGWEYEYMKFWPQIYSIYLYILLIYESQISIFDGNFNSRHQKKSAWEFWAHAEASAGRMS